MSNDEFENEDFTETKKVEDHPLTEEEWDAIPNARIRSNRVANLC